MKQFLLALFLSTMSAAAFSTSNSLALSQYMVQLGCTTAKAVDQLNAGLAKSEAIETSAAVCVPSPFVPNQGGLATNQTPPTRAERLATIVSSVSLRLDLCERTGRIGEACLKLFQR